MSEGYPLPEQNQAPPPKRETPPAARPEKPPTNPFAGYLNKKVTATRDRLEELTKWEKHRDTVRQFAKDIGIDIERHPELKAKYDEFTQEQPTTKREGKKPYYEAEVTRLEALQRGGTPEELRAEIEADFRATMQEYAEVQEALGWERFDYAKSDADIIAEKKQELKGITGQTEADNQRRSKLLADIRYVHEQPSRMEVARETHKLFVEDRRRVENKLSQLLQLRQKLPATPPATSPNIPG